MEVTFSVDVRSSSRGTVVSERVGSRSIMSPVGTNIGRVGLESGRASVSSSDTSVTRSRVLGVATEDASGETGVRSRVVVVRSRKTRVGTSETRVGASKTVASRAGVASRRETSGNRGGVRTSTDGGSEVQSLETSGSVSVGRNRNYLRVVSAGGCDGGSVG